PSFGKLGYHGVPALMATLNRHLNAIVYKFQGRLGSADVPPLSQPPIRLTAYLIGWPKPY
ncbi:MAG: hypothetical protein AABZ84_00585, partial [Pseudomonadota bacterium]